MKNKFIMLVMVKHYSFKTKKPAQRVVREVFNHASARRWADLFAFKFRDLTRKEFWAWLTK